MSGRWFSAPAFTGPWTFATPNLPEDFKRIPLTHERSRVLASVPGTTQALEAVLLAQVPQTARVSRTGVNAPDVVYQGDPQFEPIETTAVARLAAQGPPPTQAGSHRPQRRLARRLHAQPNPHMTAVATISIASGILRGVSFRWREAPAKAGGTSMANPLPSPPEDPGYGVVAQEVGRRSREQPVERHRGLASEARVENRQDRGLVARGEQDRHDVVEITTDLDDRHAGGLHRALQQGPRARPLLG